MDTLAEGTTLPVRLDLLTVLFVTLLIVSNVASTRFISVGPFTFDGGTLIFPLTYILNDILTEVYGYECARRVIWLGFGALLLASLVLVFVNLWPPAQGWDGDSAWQSIFGLMPRLVLASFVAYLVGEFTNAALLAKMKAKLAGRLLPLRLLASTAVGQFIDTLLFASVAFLGVLELSLWWNLLWSNYIFKMGLEVLLLPFTILIVHYLRKR